MDFKSSLPTSEIRESFVRHIRSLQSKICGSLEKCDGKSVFNRDRWNREEGGSGVTRVISNGEVFEKGGVNISEVYGILPEVIATALEVPESHFFACGLSLVIHPFSPMVPTVHANFRYFELFDDAGNIKDQWFGGGADLTPYYLFEEDARHFHQTFKRSCDRFSMELYPLFKKQCDEYFVNSHRDLECRGVGGIFFDYLRSEKNRDIQFWHDFTLECSHSFLPGYLPIVENKKNMSFSEKNKFWQEIRRGRYAEFNLIHDRGTLFGLKTKGRVESILMSLPPTVRWSYNYIPADGSEEAKLVNVLKNPVNWA